MAFHRPDGEPVHVETTRPELIPSVVALVAHPDDERYAQPLFGTTVTSPVFGVEIPVLAHHARRDGQGRRHRDVLHVRRPHRRHLVARAAAAGPHGHRPRRPDRPARPPSGSPRRGRGRRTRTLKGKTVFSAREAMVAKLRESGDLDGEPQPTQRMTNFYEKGDKPLEIVATRQWYIRNGGRDAAVRGEMLERGAEIAVDPAHMKHRYDNWVGGLNGDWLISRQRFFGIPFPVWYPLDGEGEPDYAHPLLPREEELPLDPSTRSPPGYSEDQRGKPGGFVGDPGRDGHLGDLLADPADRRRLGDRRRPVAAVFPMDLCTQAHDIIRTWLFSRVVRAHFENHAAPVAHALISGFILDPDRKKMSKSKGNVVVPTDDPREVRRRRGPLAGRDVPARPGLAVRRDPDEGRPAAGDEGPQRLEVRPRRRRRARSTPSRSPSRSTAPCSGGWRTSSPRDGGVRRLRLHDRRSRSTEKFFWEFCDDYLELVKERAYDEDGGAATEPRPGPRWRSRSRCSCACWRRSCPT